MAPINPLSVFISAFMIAALGGLAGTLRSRRALSWRNVVSAALSTGLMGLTMALLWYNYFEGRRDIYFLLGICGLAGLGGVTAIDLFNRIAKKGGIQIVISPQEDKGDDSTE